MASSSSSPLLLVLLPILILFSIVGPSISSPTTKITPELLKSICSKAKDQALCLSTLQNDPRSTTSNVLELTKTYTDLAYDKVSTVLELYVKGAPKPEDEAYSFLNPKYKACISDYSQNLADLGDAKKRILSSSGIDGLPDLVKGTISRVEDCVIVLKSKVGEYFPEIYYFNHKYNPDVLNFQSIVYGLALELLNQ